MILLKKTGFVKIFLFIFLLWKIIFAADIPDGKVFIKSLNITGLKHTNKGIVLRELTFSIPSEISMEEIEDFKTRLNNLIIIKRVQTTITDSILTINIEEAPRYNIFPGLEIIERSWEKINYSLNFTHFNLFKDKIYMNLNTSIGYNPGFSFYIMDDWFTSKRYILGFKAYSGRIKHKLHPFTEKHKLLSIVVGKRINRDLYFTMNNGIHFISFPKEELEFFEKENYFTKLYQFGAGLSFDKRNYKFFPTDGFYLSTSFNSESINPYEFQFKHYSSDLRFYYKIKEITLAFRQKSHFSSQDIPIYDGVFLGFGERLRGYFTETYSGKALVMNHAEARFPILPAKYYTFNSMAERAPDYFKSYFKNLYFSIYGGIFIENGCIKEHFRNLTLKESMTGYGFSLYFLFPFHNLMRADFAFNDKGEYEFVIENRVSF